MNAIPGYTFRHLEECDGGPPITTAVKAFGLLWIGIDIPKIILSSEKTMKRVKYCLKPEHIVPVIHEGNEGFMFSGARWSYPSPESGIEIEDGWVFMMNPKKPNDPRLNGYYRMMEAA